MNNLKNCIKEYKTAILVVVSIFVITPLVKWTHDKLAEQTFTKERWVDLKPRILKSCAKNVYLKTSGDNFFQEDQNFYLFVCDHRDLIYQLDENNQWTWGDFIVDEDFFIYHDDRFLFEVLKVWEKSGDYQAHLAAFQGSNRNENLSQWLMRQRDKLNNKALGRQMEKFKERQL